MLRVPSPQIDKARQVTLRIDLFFWLAKQRLVVTSSVLADGSGTADLLYQWPVNRKPISALALLLADLSVTKTHSRPYTSDDNPFSESQFRTMKYRPAFPDRFGLIQDSRTFARPFSPWYNDDHRHSGIGMMTPAMVHYGLASEVRQTDKVFSMPPTGFIQNASSVSAQLRICCPRRSGSTSHSTQKKNSLNNSLECLKLVDTHRVRSQ